MESGLLGLCGVNAVSQKWVERELVTTHLLKMEVQIVLGKTHKKSRALVAQVSIVLIQSFQET